ncbi:MAG: beta-ketoacyl-ACP synthase II [Candidatus Coatesbacteria bacterium]|nr:beta-ketoacyl-ACP synthase II [Candidatus Coatesbacteria bacterium]
MPKRVAITGLGVISPLGLDTKSFWDGLKEGLCGIRRITYFDASEYSSQIAGEVKDFDPTIWMSSKEARKMDLFCRYAIAASQLAIDDSGVDLSEIEKERFGVIIGSGIGGIITLEEQHRILIEKGPRRISPFFIPMMISDMASGLIAIRYEAKGINYSTVSACASGAHSLTAAFRSIKYGESDMVLCGGTEATISPLSVAGFCSMKALSTRNDNPGKSSRPFDKERDGFIMAEGSGIVLFEEVEHAKKRGARIYAEVIGAGATADAYHITAPAPEGEGARRAMNLAIQEGEISLENVDYINAHGTSTELNDKEETLAIKLLFKEHSRRIKISSIKSMVGHMLGAAGGVECAATALSLYHGIIPPTINYEFPDPDCDLDYVPNVTQELKINYALSNSFGFGGHNVSLLLKKFE